MTAQEFVNNHLETNSFPMEKMLVAMLQDFAILKCLEQRQICANEATITNDYGSGGELFDCVDRDAIINSPNPEM